MSGMFDYLTDVAFDRRQGVKEQCLKFFLHMAAFLFGIGVACKRGLYQRGILRKFRAPMPVISVGNVTAGGTGKTPMVVMLFRLLKAGGHHPMVLIRGYMAGQGGESDEAVMLQELIGPHVYVGADRVCSFQQAHQTRQYDCVILDDGFQQWGFARDLDIVLVDSPTGFGNGRLLPRGILRELPSVLSRADAVVLTRSDRVPEDQLDKLKLSIRNLAPKALLLAGAHQSVGARELFTGRSWDPSALKGGAAAMCAIGSPESFRHTLASMGVEPLLFQAFPDHYRFTPQDAVSLTEACRKKNINRIFVTHKDAVKLKGFSGILGGMSVLVVYVEFKLKYGETEFLAILDHLHRP